MDIVVIKIIIIFLIVKLRFYLVLDRKNFLYVYYNVKYLEIIIL